MNTKARPKKQTHASRPAASSVPAAPHTNHISILGEVPEKSDWVRRPFSIHAVGVVIRGRGWYTAGDGERQRIEAPALFSVFPGPRFEYGPDPGTTWHELHVGCTGTDSDAWVARGLLPIDGKAAKLSTVRHANRRLREAIRERQSGRIESLGRFGEEPRIKPLVELALIELALARRDAPSEPMRQRVQPVIEYLREHFAEPTDWNKISRRFAMSYSLLRKEIRLHTGLAPQKYVTRLRCRAAAEMLHQSDETIDAIGRRVGCDDASVFSRTFTRTMGMPPRDYRKQRLA